MAEETSQYPKGYQPTPDSETQLYKLQLPNFDGPLNLLLFLIKKHDLDILDIPLGPICEHYLRYLDIMSELNIDLAAGFLAMAAELAHLKSRMLVPQPETVDDSDEEVGDPRAELVRRLLEYQKYKDAGEQLAKRDVLGRDTFVRTAAPEAALTASDGTLAEVPIFKLIEALDRLLAKGKIELKHDVVLDNLSVADKLQFLVDKLRSEESVSFLSLFEGASTRREVICTFLAILELGKMKLVRIHQIDTDGDIFVRGIPDKLVEFDGGLKILPGASVAGTPVAVAETGAVDDYR